VPHPGLLANQSSLKLQRRISQTLLGPHVKPFFGILI